MSNTIGPLYVEHLDYIAAVVKLLNESKLPDNDEFYIHVELRNSEHYAVGSFSDEIASDCWSFESPARS